MTIKSIQPFAVQLPFEIGGPKPLFAGKPRHMDILFVRVETSDGVVGWGEGFGLAVWPATRAAVQELVAPIATGRDESDTGALMDDLMRKLHLLGRTGPVIYALSALDIALWDIAGKRAGKPVHALLGGAKRTTLEAYASLMRYGDAALVAKNAKAALARGYRHVKLHEVGVDMVRAAREAIGPDVSLMMDVNCPWTVDEALAVADAVRPYDLHWFEEPVYPPEDYAALAAVRAKARTPIGAGENAVSWVDFQRMFEIGAVDYAQPSVTKIGGITQMMRIAALAKTHGVKLALHSPYFGSGLLATLHVAAVLDEPTLVEVSFAELGANPLGDAIDVIDGRMKVPMAPGLGRDPDPAILAKFAA